MVLKDKTVGQVKPDYQSDNVTLYLGDCLEKMYAIPDGSVDAIIADLPYGTTACKWDTVIPLNEYILVGKKKLEYDKFLMLCYMNGVELDAAKEQWQAEKQIGLWTHFKRVLKPRGAAVLFGS